MAEFIATSILMVCLGAVLYLMVRALPRVAEDLTEKPGLLDRWAHSEVPEKVDAALNGFLLKLLRRLKVGMLKLDNALSKHVRKISQAKSGDKKSAIDFKEITGENKEIK